VKYQGTQEWTRGIGRRRSHRGTLALLASLALLATAGGAFGQTLEEPGGAAPSARALIGEGRFGEAIPLLREELRADPTNDDARLLLARVLSWNRQYDASLAEYRILLDRHPNNAQARAGYARVLSWSGRYAESIREYRIAIASDSTNLETRVGYARALSWSGDVAGASQEYFRILSLNAKQADAWLGLASVARWRGASTASDRFVTRARGLGADPAGAAEEELAVRTALEPSIGGGWVGSSEREYVTGPDFTIESTGPYAQARATLGRSAGVTARVGWLQLKETPSESVPPSDSDTLDYDLNSVDYRADVALLRGYPWQVSFGAEYSTFSSRSAEVFYPLTADDDFVGWNARVWRFTNRLTPSLSARRSFLPLKLIDPSTGARYFDPGHVDNYEAKLAWQWNGRGTADALVSPGFYSDDNRRSTISGGATYRIQARVPFIGVDGRLTWADWDFASPNYFTPLNSLRATAGLSVRGYAERPAADYGFRYGISGISSSNFDNILIHAWSGYANVTVADAVPLGLEAEYSIDNNSYETWYLGLSAAARW